MQFCSFNFLVFYVVVFSLYWAIPWKRGRVWLLLVAASTFTPSGTRSSRCSSACPRRSTTFSPWAWTGPARGRPCASCYVVVSIVANLGLLCYFKYANFFLDSLDEACRLAASLDGRHRARAGHHPAGRHLVLHLRGHQLHGGRLSAARCRRSATWPTSCCSSCSSRTWWPGPSCRARDFLPQIRRHKHFELAAHAPRRASSSSWACSRSWPSPTAWPCSPIRSSPTPAPTAPGRAWLGVSPTPCRSTATSPATRDMAIGTRPPARLPAGPELRHALPGAPTSPSSGGAGTSRCRPGCATTCSSRWAAAAAPAGWRRRNLLITMTLGGLWHGAGWNFVVFGLLQGLLLIIHRVFKDYCKTRPALDAWLQTAAGTSFPGGLPSSAS